MLSFNKYPKLLVFHNYVIIDTWNCQGGWLNRSFTYSAKEPGLSVIFKHEIRLSGVRASITIVHVRKFYKM